MKGCAVTPGMPIMTIMDNTSMLFEAEISEEDIGRVALKQSASVILDSNTTNPLKGTVVSIDEVAHNTLTGGTFFSVRIQINKAADLSLCIGMKGDATIQISQLSSAMTISRKGLFSEEGENFVYVVESGQLQKKSVTVGDVTDEVAEIKSGLTLGEKIALPDNTSFEDGLKVAEN